MITIILVRPQLAENIGTTARAMANFGLDHLRLVGPLQDHLSQNARRASAGAECVLEQAHIYNDIADAVADMNMVYATSARNRDIHKPNIPLKEAVADIINQDMHQNIGILFGPERTGLTNEDIKYAGQLVHVPLSKTFSSLNLAQAVLLFGYEYFQQKPHEAYIEQVDIKPASQQEITHFLQRLVTRLETKNFFLVPEKQPLMEQKIYNMFQNQQLSSQDIAIWHGILTALDEV